MTNKEFERLIEKRKDWVKSSKENKFDFNSILTDLYIDPSHFIYEILQNAEDANAKEVRFVLFEDRLDVYHNGTDFDIKDIDGVTGIGISKKKEDLNLIGKFGIGFKSVFAVTETPYIFSGEYKIKIEDFVIPSVVNNNEQVDGTLIRLPFNHEKRKPEEVFTLIAPKIENMCLKTLLFLKNIEKIKWRTPSSSGLYLTSSKCFEEISNTKRVTIKSSSKSSSVTEGYIVIGKPITIEGKDLRVEVAYKLGQDENGNDIIVPEPDPKLVVFFPTEKSTFLNFVIQGPYKTTPNRADIPLDDEQNKVLIEETGNLIAESLSVIKDLGYLDTDFLSILPINPKVYQSYSVICKKVKEKFLSEELLPTLDGKHTKASDALLAQGKELTDFLDSNDIQELFSKQHWLDTNITYDKTRKLREYLINELEIVEVDFETFARKITDDFLQTKSDDWMINFYSRLLNQQSLWSDGRSSRGILRTKPIIRLENDEHIAPIDDNGKIQVYLPAETESNYKTVKHILTENEKSLNFLKALGLTKPDLFAEIKEFIRPKYQTDNPAKDECYFEDFEKLLKAYETIPENKEKEFIKALSEASFIDSVKADTGEKHLRKPAEIYFNVKDIKDYFEGYNLVYFIDDGLYEKFGGEMLRSFLIELGVEDKPRRIKIEKVADLPPRIKIDYVGYTDRDIHQIDYEYEGFDNFICNRTISKSVFLWNSLLKNVEKLSGLEIQKFFKGKNRWYYQSEQSETFDANFLKSFRQQKWLVDRNNNFRKPSDVTFGELPDDYIKESPNIEILIKVLGFKPEIIDQLPEDDRKKLEIAKDITPEELKKLISDSKKEPKNKEEKIWTPEYGPDTFPGNIKVLDPDKIVTSDLTGQGEQIATENGNEQPNKDKKPIEEDIHERNLIRWQLGNGAKNMFIMP